MEALVLERKGELSIREIDLPAEVGPYDVKIAIHTVGICGSDVHYYEYVLSAHSSSKNQWSSAMKHPAPWSRSDDLQKISNLATVSAWNLEYLARIVAPA